jgi:HSP20 family protein
VRSRIHAVVVPSEAGDFADEVRQVFVELGRGYGLEALVAECSPPLDLLETDEAFEISMDLPGVSSETVRVMLKGGAVLIAGDKSVRRGRGESSFHLLERGFGRFARVVRLPGPCDGQKARATLAHGELRVVLPKIADRRGRVIQIAVRSAPP